MAQEFSFRTRKTALGRFRNEKFDLLIIGGGITGAAVARDASSRGLKVALVEKCDFAWGTSSRSSKLIHGGLRYLENVELSLVHESLSERAHLLKTAPHLVRPLSFYLPVYEDGARGKVILSLGLWIYDLLTLFRGMGFHKELSKKEFLKEVPNIRGEGLKGGFRYFDASMWDDALVIDTLRAAQREGTVVANYVEAVSPIWKDENIVGFKMRDCQSNAKSEISLHAKKIIVCGGPWTDELGKKLSSNWESWIRPSKGIHLVFDLKRFPVPGAVVMGNPKDRRNAFVIPRTDLGEGVVIVGTTDAPTPSDPAKAVVEHSDVKYLMDLLQRYFPKLNLKTSDIISAYVGVRPLMGSDLESDSSEKHEKTVLQKVSREHHIGKGPGGVVLVAGGKYTTHRMMAKEIVDFAMKGWKLKQSRTESPVNPQATPKAMKESRFIAKKQKLNVPAELFDRYAGEALEVVEWGKGVKLEDPSGFPLLAGQLCHAIRTEMVLHLEDFYLRRVPLFLARKDHGLPWAEGLSKVWAKEMGLGDGEALAEVERLKREVEKRDLWRTMT